MWTIIAAGVIWGLMGGVATAYVRSLRWKRKQRGRIDFARTYIPIHPDLGHPDARPPGCRHQGELVAVTTESEPEPVRYICAACLDEFEPDSGLVRAHRATERNKELRRKADREFAAMFSGLSAEKQAIEEAALRRAEAAKRFELLLSRGTVDTIVASSITPDEIFTTGYQPSEWDDAR